MNRYALIGLLIGSITVSGLVYATSSYWMRFFFSAAITPPETESDLDLSYFPECAPILLFRETPLYSSFEQAIAIVDSSNAVEVHTLLGVRFENNAFNSIIHWENFGDVFESLAATYDASGKHLLIFSPTKITVFDPSGEEVHQVILPNSGNNLPRIRHNGHALQRDSQGHFWILETEEFENMRYRVKLSRLEKEWRQAGALPEEISIIPPGSPNLRNSYAYFFARPFSRRATSLYLAWIEVMNDDSRLFHIAHLNAQDKSLTLLPPIPESDGSDLVDLHSAPQANLVALWAKPTGNPADHLMKYCLSHWDSSRWVDLGEMGQFLSGQAAAALAVTPIGEVILATIDTQPNIHWRKRTYTLTIRSWDPSLATWKVVHPNLGGGLSLDPRTHKEEPRLWFHEGELYLSWLEETPAMGYSVTDLFFAIYHDGMNDQQLRDVRSPATDLFVLTYRDGQWIDVMTSRQDRRGMIPALMSRGNHLPVSCL